MANNREKRAQPVMVDPSVNATRQQYYSLLATGYDKDTAAQIANGDLTLEDAGPPKGKMDSSAMVPRTVQKLIMKPGQKPEPVSDAPAKVSKVDSAELSNDGPAIPQNWQNSGWPQLKALALSVSPGTPITNRVEATEAIQSEIQRRATMRVVADVE